MCLPKRWGFCSIKQNWMHDWHYGKGRFGLKQVYWDFARLILQRGIYIFPLPIFRKARRSFRVLHTIILVKEKYIFLNVKSDCFFCFYISYYSWLDPLWGFGPSFLEVGPCFQNWIDFAQFGLASSMVFKGTTGVYRTYWSLQFQMSIKKEKRNRRPEVDFTKSFLLLF